MALVHVEWKRKIRAIISRKYPKAVFVLLLFYDDRNGRYDLSFYLYEAQFEAFRTERDFWSKGYAVNLERSNNALTTEARRFFDFLDRTIRDIVSGDLRVSYFIGTPDKPFKVVGGAPISTKPTKPYKSNKKIGTLENSIADAILR